MPPEAPRGSLRRPVVDFACRIDYHPPSSMQASAALLVGLWLAAPASKDPIRAKVRSLHPKVVQWRRDIHANPELGNREFRTARLVADHLKALNLAVKTGIAHTGVAAVFDTGTPGPTIALRADMDALPVTERTGLPFASKVTTTYRGKKTGVMHACGHDAHTAILMGAAEALVGMKDDLRGRILFIFQPAEEGAPAGEEGGARLMLEQGLFRSVKPERVYGLHVTSSLPTGVVALREGPILASADSFTITVRGRQTHGSRPWGGVDPIVIAAQIVTTAQTIVSRESELTTGPAVLSFGAIEGGIRNNIIPDKVEMIGTIRTFDPDMRKKIHRRLQEVARGVGRAMGAQVDVSIESGYPVTVNDVSLVQRVRPVLEHVVGKEKVIRPELRTGAEDFSYYAQQAAGAFFFVGVTPVGRDPATAPTNHSPLFYIDEAALRIGLEAMVRVAVDGLR